VTELGRRVLNELILDELRAKPVEVGRNRDVVHHSLGLQIAGLAEARTDRLIAFAISHPRSLRISALVKERLRGNENGGFTVSTCAHSRLGVLVLA
jgi:hypothetical protein